MPYRNVYRVHPKYILQWLRFYFFAFAFFRDSLIIIRVLAAHFSPTFHPFCRLAMAPISLCAACSTIIFLSYNCRQGGASYIHFFSVSTAAGATAGPACKCKDNGAKLTISWSNFSFRRTCCCYHPLMRKRWRKTAWKFAHERLRVIISRKASDIHLVT